MYQYCAHMMHFYSWSKTQILFIFASANFQTAQIGPHALAWVLIQNTAKTSLSASIITNLRYTNHTTPHRRGLLGVFRRANAHRLKTSVPFWNNSSKIEFSTHLKEKLSLFRQQTTVDDYFTTAPPPWLIPRSSGLFRAAVARCTVRWWFAGGVRANQPSFSTAAWAREECLSTTTVLRGRKKEPHILRSILFYFYFCPLLHVVTAALLLLLLSLLLFTVLQSGSKTISFLKYFIFILYARFSFLLLSSHSFLLFVDYVLGVFILSYSLLFWFSIF